MSRAQMRLALSAIVVGVLVLLDSIAARILVSSDRALTKSYRTYSPYYHHDLRPSVRVVARSFDRSYEVATNSLGFRDSVVRSVPLKGSLPRLLFLGDSFTESVGVPFGSSFVSRVQQGLPDEEVLDGAVVSYCPIIYYRKSRFLIEERGVHVDAVVVFLDISDIEDETEFDFDADGNVIETAEFAKNRVRGLAGDYLVEHSATIQVMHRLLERAEVRWNWNRPEALMSLLPFAAERGRWTFDDRVYGKFGEDGLRKARRHMDMLRGLLQRHGISLYLAVYPWPQQIVFDTTESKQVRYWREWAGSEGVPFLDYFPLFMTGDKTRTLHEYFIPGDIHWNEAGHALVADEFLKFYRYQKSSRRADLREGESRIAATLVPVVTGPSVLPESTEKVGGKTSAVRD